MQWSEKSDIAGRLRMEHQKEAEALPTTWAITTFNNKSKIFPATSTSVTPAICLSIDEVHSHRQHKQEVVTSYE